MGAGAAGMAAAARLVEKGLPQSQLTILEAENRIGGRINTVQYGRNIIYYLLLFRRPIYHVNR